MATFCLFAVLFWRPEGERLVWTDGLGVLADSPCHGPCQAPLLPRKTPSGTPLASANVMDPAGGGGDSSSCQVRMSVPCALSRTEGWATGVLTLWALIHHGNRTTSYSAMCDTESKCI